MGSRDGCRLFRLCSSLSLASSPLGAKLMLQQSIEQVKHPFTGVSSELVAKRLARKAGVIALPGSFFSPSFKDVNDDAYIRFCESSHVPHRISTGADAEFERTQL